GTADTVSLYGHSYGGLLALKLAGILGPRLRALFVMEPVLYRAALGRGDLEPEAHEQIRRFFDQTWFFTDDARGGTAEWLEHFIDFFGPGTWAKMAPPARAYAERVGWKVYQEVVSCARDETPIEAYRFSVPFTVVIAGASPSGARGPAQVLARLN